MDKKIDLTIIIVNYNTRKLLRDCLQSIRKSIEYRVQSIDKKRSKLQTPNSKLQVEVFVVDNGSEDGSVEMVKSIEYRVQSIERKSSKLQTPNSKLSIKLIENSENFGFAKANNQALRLAQGRYILFLNPDTIVYEKTLSTPINYMDRNPRVGVVTCRVELPNGKLDDACHRGFPSPWNALCHFSGVAKIFPRAKIFNGYSLGCLPLGKIHEIDSCCGAFLLTKKEILDKVGFFDEGFFWYGEDLDLCFRIKRAGFKIIFYPKVKIIHYKGASSGIKETSKDITMATDETRRKAISHSVRAMKIFYDKHYKEKYPKVVSWLVNLGTSLLLKVRLMKIR